MSTLICTYPTPPTYRRQHTVRRAPLVVDAKETTWAFCWAWLISQDIAFFFWKLWDGPDTALHIVINASDACSFSKLFVFGKKKKKEKKNMSNSWWAYIHLLSGCCLCWCKSVTAGEKVKKRKYRKERCEQNGFHITDFLRGGHYISGVAARLSRGKRKQRKTRQMWVKSKLFNC